MTATGIGFALTTAFWPLLLLAFVGTINPTSGDAGVFPALEQAALSEIVAPQRRTALFAGYSLIGSLATALGTLAAAIPDLAADATGMARASVMQAMFALYGCLGLVGLLLYRPLSPAVEAAEPLSPAALGPSRRLVCGMAALFGLDSSGTGFLVQSLVALWLYQRFALSVTAAASILF